MSANSNLNGCGGEFGVDLGGNLDGNGGNFGENLGENCENSSADFGKNPRENGENLPNSNLAQNGENCKNRGKTNKNRGKNFSKTRAQTRAQNGKTPAPTPPQLFVISNTPPPPLNGVTHLEVLKIRTFDLTETLAGAAFRAVIFTSKHGVEAWRQMRYKLAQSTAKNPPETTPATAPNSNLAGATPAKVTEKNASNSNFTGAGADGEAPAKTARHPALNADLVAFCLSEASAQTARGAGFARVFTPDSPNAIDFAAKLTQILRAAASGGRLPPHLSQLYALFGAKTAAQNPAQNGANSNLTGANGSDGAEKPPRLLWVRGAEVAYELGAALREAGFACDEVAGYENAPIAQHPLAAQTAGEQAAGEVAAQTAGENGAQNGRAAPPRGSHLLFTSGANARAFAREFGWDISWHAHATGRSAADALGEIFAGVERVLCDELPSIIAAELGAEIGDFATQNGEFGAEIDGKNGKFGADFGADFGIEIDGENGENGENYAAATRKILRRKLKINCCTGANIAQCVREVLAKIRKSRK